MTNWLDRPIAETAAALRDGKLSARSLTEEAIARHDKWDGQLQAYKSWDSDYALAQADLADGAFKAGRDLGPAQGLIFSVKDIYGVVGFPTFAGSPKQLPTEDWSKDGTMVATARNQLCVVPGKTHTVEFAYGGLGTNLHWGTPRNPWDADDHRTPGGSSCGAGVSLWEGSAQIAYGTDTGGSVRVPASMTGCAGLKTTKGRWPTDGITELSATMDTPGILARSVADLAYGFACLDPAARAANAKPITPAEIGSVRIGTTSHHFWESCDADVADTVERAISEICAQAGRTTPIAFPEAGESVRVLGEGAIVAAEGWAFLERCLPDWIDTLDPLVRSRMEDGRVVTAPRYLNALRRIAELQASTYARMREIDVLLVPTIPATPPKVDDVQGANSYKAANLLALSNTMPGNVLGLCGITLLAGKDSSGMPVGLQLIAKPNDEERLIAVAQAIENVIGSAVDRLGRPPLGGSS